MSNSTPDPEETTVPAETGTDPAVDATGEANEGETYHGYSVDDETQPQGTDDSLVDDDRNLDDPLDEGFSPPEKWSAGQRYGNTPLEESLGESLDQRVQQEVPEPDPYAVAEDEARRDDPGAAGSEVGTSRAGRLVEPDEGVRTDRDKDLVADDVGIDGAGAGAEEAAVHEIEDPDGTPPG